MGRPARSGVCANAGARGQSRGLAKGFARSLAGAIVGPYTSLMSSSFFPSSSSCPLLAWRLPLPSQPRAAFPHPVLQTPAISQTFLLEARTHTSVAQLLLTFSQCFWKGKQPLRFAAQTVAEHPRQPGGVGGNGAHGHSRPIHQAADSQLGGRERCPPGSQDPPFLPRGSLMLGCVAVTSSMTPMKSM